MIIYPSGVYTFSGQIQEEDMQMFWVYSYKGFSRTAARRAFWMAGVISTRCSKDANSSGNCLAGSCSATTRARYSAWEMAGSKVRA